MINCCHLLIFNTALRVVKIEHGNINDKSTNNKNNCSDLYF